MAKGNTFGVADLVVFSVTIVISIGIGIYYAVSGGKQKTTTEYLLGGRLISFLPAAISLMVSFESSIMMLGLPAEGYVYGMQNIIGTAGFFVSQLMAITLVVPLLYPLKITSVYEYLEYRFNSKAVRLLGTSMGMLTYCWYMGIVLFGPAVALEAVTGLPRWTSMSSITLVAVIYTSIGGLKAVVWTDVFQAFVMWAGIFAILIKGTMEVGGPKAVWDKAQTGGRLNFFNFDPDPRVRHTFFNLFLGNLIRGFGLIFNQSTAQRISSTKSLKEAKRMLWIVAPAFSISFFLALYEGVVAYTYYETKECDPFKSKKLTNPNQIIPFFVLDVFENLPGMPGLFLASLFSASLSTLSSGLSSLSAMLWADIVHPLVGDMSDIKGTLIAKLSVLAFGALACGLAFLVSLIGGTLIQISGSVLSAFGGPVTGLFLLGCFCPRANAKGALTGGVIGLAFACWISFGQNFSDVVKKTPWLPAASTDQCSAFDLLTNTTSSFNATTMMTTLQSIVTTTLAADVKPEPTGVLKLYTLSYTWIAPIGILSTILIGWITSLIIGPNKPGEVDPRYLLEFSRIFGLFLPKRVQDWMSSCGTQFIKEEYKANFPDPALKETWLHKEIIIQPSENGKEKDQLIQDSHDKAHDTPGHGRGDIDLTVVYEIERGNHGTDNGDNTNGKVSEKLHKENDHSSRDDVRDDGNDVNGNQGNDPKQV